MKNKKNLQSLKSVTKYDFYGALSVPTYISIKVKY